MNNSLVLGVIIPVKVSSTYNITLHELKKTTTATQRQRWLKTCKKDKEAEEVKRPHGFNWCDLILDQQESVTGLFSTDFMYGIVKHLSY